MAIYARFAAVEGGALTVGREGWIDILSLEWSAGWSESTAGRRGSRASAQVDDMVLTMLYDKAAPVLQAYCLKGKSIDKLEVELTQEQGGSDESYLRYELQEVVITSYQTRAEAGDDMPAGVILSCRFRGMKVVYTEFAADGSARGSVECKYKRGKS